MATFRTRPPAWYLPPTKEEMREQAEQSGLKKFSADLVEDLCNLAAGGEICPPSEWQHLVREHADRKLPAPDGDGDWKVDDSHKESGTSSGYTKDRQIAVDYRAQRGMRSQQAVCDFLNTIELDKFPGDSPLEQATNLLKLLATQRGGSGEGSDGETLPIFAEGDPGQTAEKLNDIMDDVESLDEAEKELLESDEDDSDSGEGHGEDENLRKMKLAEDMAKGKDVWLKISRQLDQMAKMRVSKSNEVVYDPEGEDVRSRPIRDLGELAKIRKESWALRQAAPTLFMYRALAGQLPVRERVRRIEKQQLLYVIIDCSGSMDDGQRIARAGGVLMNRLKAVINGEAQLYVRFFDSKLYEERFISTPAEAKEAMRRFAEKNFSGGGTAIDRCVREAQKRIEEIVTEGQVTRPELVVVTDGDDSVSLRPEALQGTKLHAFVVEESHPALTDLAVGTGGVGLNRL